VVVLKQVRFPFFAHDETSEEKLGESQMTYYMYKDVNGQWRWYLEAANNRKIANSGEGYHNESDCLAAIRLVQGSGSAPIKKV
jgi:uncharacterized protein YegP (UPF0339 family)